MMYMHLLLFLILSCPPVSHFCNASSLKDALCQSAPDNPVKQHRLLRTGDASDDAVQESFGPVSLARDLQACMARCASCASDGITESMC